MKKLDRIIEEKKVIICIGAGGVGKTTISSLFALEGVSKGKRTLALTVDPSRRLAQSLGVSPSSAAGKLSKRRLSSAGYKGSGELSIKVLDVKRTFDELIEKVADTAQVSGRILANNYYRSVADSLAGAHEYMAMEALLSSYEEDEYDLIIVDTPPSEHLSGFLSAPLRLSAILDSKGFKSFFLMDKLSFGFTRLFTSMSLKFIQRIVGLDVLHDMWEFFSDFEEVSEGISLRAGKTYDLLKSSDSSFAIITNLKKPSLQNAADWQRDLTTEGYNVDAMIVNRTAIQKHLAGLGDIDRSGLPGGRDLREKLVRNYKNYKNIIDAETTAMKGLESGLPCFAIPDLDTEIISLKDLHGLREYIFE